MGWFDGIVEAWREFWGNDEDENAPDERQEEMQEQHLEAEVETPLAEEQPPADSEDSPPPPPSEPV